MSIKKKVGFDENNSICKRCVGYGNQLFLCHYCVGYDHFEEKEVGGKELVTNKEIPTWLKKQTIRKQKELENLPPLWEELLMRIFGF